MIQRIQKDADLLLLGMLASTLSDPNKTSNPKQFYQASYRNHAFYHIVNEVINSKEQPYKVITDFRDRMLKAACDSYNNGYMFSVAADTADWILDELS